MLHCFQGTPTPEGLDSYSWEEIAVPTPCVGMEYSSWEEIDAHFRNYGKQNGFGVTRIGVGYKQKDNKITKERRSMTWRCEQYGVHKPSDNIRYRSGSDQNNTAHRTPSVGSDGVVLGATKSKKCKCPVRLYAGNSPDNIWRIRNVVLEHENHQPTPSNTGNSV